MDNPVQSEKTPANKVEMDLTTNEHKAIESMLLMFGTTGYEHSAEFINMATALDFSPAFREFSESMDISPFEAAKLLIAGGMYQRLAKQS